MKVAVGSQKIEIFPTDFLIFQRKKSFFLKTLLTNVVVISMVDLVMGLIWANSLFKKLAHNLIARWNVSIWICVRRFVLAELFIIHIIQLCPNTHQYFSLWSLPWRKVSIQTFHRVIDSVFKYCTAAHELTTLYLNEMAWRDILSGPGKSVESTTSITWPD